MAALYWSFNEAARHLNRKPKTGGVLDCFERAKAYIVLNPGIGDQFIMDFGRGKGHTGIVQAVRSSSVWTLEGNTAADPSYAGEDREGNGVFERHRPISTIKAFIRYV